MATLVLYINCKATIFTKINYIFLVRRHTHIEDMPYRVFRHIEQVLQKKENIVSPKQYIDILKKCCTVKKYKKEFVIYNYTSAVKKIIQIRI